MAKILLLSNGHGEDLSGSLIGKSLEKIGHQVFALPMVGTGKAYSRQGIKIICKGKNFKTGGLGYTSLKGRITEIVEGQLLYLITKVWHFLSTAKTYDLVVVIGDVLPVITAWIGNLNTCVYLVAYSSHYEGKLSLPWPCKSCLRSRKFLGIYSRDQLTAEDLSKQLDRDVLFLGNPFMDEVLTEKKHLPKCIHRIGLLPGSRRPELENNLLFMLSVIEFLPEKLLVNEGLELDLGLVNSMGDNDLKRLISKTSWQLVKNNSRKTTELIRNQHLITVRRDSFNSVLQSSDILLCMAGTAAEQAVGLAKPVLQLPGNGPQFTNTFAEAQRRLLGPTVFCADGATGSSINFANTANLAIKLLAELKGSDMSLKKDCNQQAKVRLGTSGGAKLIALDISNKITK